MKTMRVGCLLAHAHNIEGHFVILYVDDYTGVDPENVAFNSVKSFDDKLHKIGLLRSKEKDEEPSHIKNLLGIEFDCNRMEMRLGSGNWETPGHLFLFSSSVLAAWSPLKSQATLKEICSLAEQFLNVTKVVPQSRPFLSRILHHFKGPSKRPSDTCILLDTENRKTFKNFSTLLQWDKDHLSPELGSSQ
jgi:hypothetical protein